MLRSEFHTAPLCRFCLVSTVRKTCVPKDRRPKCYVDCFHKNSWKIQKLHLNNHLISLLSTKHKNCEFQYRQWGPQKLVMFEVLAMVMLRIQVLGWWHLVTWCVAQNCLILQMKANQSFKTSGRTNPISQGHIPADLTAQQYTAKTSHLTGLHRQLQP
jgi:hypothetical protein